MKRRDFLAASIASSLAALNQHRLGAATHAYDVARDYPAWASDSVFLQGINAPVFQEIDVDRLPISGSLPADLEGMYIRNGPNPMFRPSSYLYPLEGDGMLHALYFDGASVRYRNRWILTRGLVYEMAAKQALPEVRFRNYANTSIVSHGGKLLALYETGLPYEVTPDLDTIGEWDFHGAIDRAMTAHPHLDPHTGELHFYRYSFFTEPYLIYYVANAEGVIVRTTPIALDQPALIHDMNLTENYVIFFHCPLALDLQAAMQQGMPFVWRPEQGTRIAIVDRHDAEKKPLWIETEPFWVWHFMNAFEANGEITIDFAYYPQMTLDSTLDAMLANRSNFQRMVINLQTRSVQQTALDDRVADFPVIDRRYTGKPYRFGYMPHLDRETVLQKGVPNYFSEIIQYDVGQQTSKVHRLRSGCYSGEPVVVPRANARSEAESYVMTWVFDENRQASDFVILDAANFDQEPIAQIHLPVRVPMGSHGSWISARPA